MEEPLPWVSLEEALKPGATCERLEPSALASCGATRLSRPGPGGGEQGAGQARNQQSCGFSECKEQEPIPRARPQRALFRAFGKETRSTGLAEPGAPARPLSVGCLSAVPTIFPWPPNFSAPFPLSLRRNPGFSLSCNCALLGLLLLQQRQHLHN